MRAIEVQLARQAEGVATTVAGGCEHALTADGCELR
jgi:hypothetical protein